ncbi:hypothetical protein [Phenylobacterium sp.]|uniref:hypothetical protein n=1 Tax=Phenylobacterium sp. TaxID=1871053 RepID=UPI003BAB756E
MRMLLLAASLLAATPLVAAAEDESVRDANRQDVRCFIGMAAMSRNEQYKSWGALGMFFYAGRVEGRTPGFDLSDAVKREARAIAPASYNDLIRECSDRLGEKSRSLEAMKPPPPRGVGR